MSQFLLLKDANKDIQRKTNLLIRDVDDVKQGLSLLQVCRNNDKCAEPVCTNCCIADTCISQDQNKDSRQKLTRVIKEVHGIKQAILEVKLLLLSRQLHIHIEHVHIQDNLMVALSNEMKKIKASLQQSEVIS